MGSTDRPTTCVYDRRWLQQNSVQSTERARKYSRAMIDIVWCGKTLPIVGSVVAIVTLIVCIVIARVDDVYVGGLDWPYFSDIGRGTF